MIKNNKGITLIALVVTIIILLILAGVSIMTLTGDNGIINRTHQAKQLSEEAAAREKVKLAVQAARVHDNSYSYLKASEVVTAVNNEEGLSTPVVENPSFPIVVTAGKFTFSVSSTGEVGYIEGISIPSELTVGVGLQGQTITPALEPGITGTIIWKSSDESKVKVNNGALTVEAVTGANPVKITASIKDLATGIEYNGECLVTAKNAYTVSYYGEDKTTLLQQISVFEGTKASDATGYAIPTAPEGQVFDKWLLKTAVDGYVVGSEATGLLDDVTRNLDVYAQWRESITYDELSSVTTWAGFKEKWEVLYQDGTNIYLIHKDYMSNSYAPSATGITKDSGGYKIYSVTSRGHVTKYLMTSSNWQHIASGVATKLNSLTSTSNYSTSNVRATGAPSMAQIEKGYQGVNSNFKVGYYDSSTGKVYTTSEFTETDGSNWTLDGTNVPTGAVTITGSGTAASVYEDNGTSAKSSTSLVSGFVYSNQGTTKWNTWISSCFSSSTANGVMNSSIYNTKTKANGYWLGGVSANSANDVCLVDNRGLPGNCSFSSKAYGARPVVSVQYSASLYSSLTSN